MAKGLTPIIGLAVVVALAMVAVFGAMSLADPAQAAIDRAPAPTAMAVTSDGIMEEPGVLIDPMPTAEGAPLVTFEDSEVTYTLDNFAGNGPVTAGDAGPTYVVEFELVGAFSTSDDRILIELPEGAVVGDMTAADVEVRGPRPTDVVAERPDYESATEYNYLDEIDALNYDREDGLVNNVKHLIITLDGGRLTAARGVTNNDPIKLRVIILGMTNPKGHGGHDVNIYHYTTDDPGTTEADDSALVGVVRTATLMINSVMVVEDKNDDGEATGAYTLTFFAQQDYETSDKIEIEMPKFSLPRTIVEDDVQITWPDGDKPPRSVDQARNSVTLEVPNPGIAKNALVKVQFFKSAGISKPSGEGSYPWTVDDSKSANHASVMTAADEPDIDDQTGEPVVVEPDEQPAMAGLPSFVAESTSPGGGGSFTVTFQTESGKLVNTREDDLVIEFHEDYDIPSTIRNTSVAITTTLEGRKIADGGTPLDKEQITFTPEDVTVDGEKVLISLGDMDERDDQFDYEVFSTEVIKVHFRQSAGITNPTEAGGYNIVAIEFGDAVGIEYNDATAEDLPGLDASIVPQDFPQ